jgi:hypothetical protein
MAIPSVPIYVRLNDTTHIKYVALCSMSGTTCPAVNVPCVISSVWRRRLLSFLDQLVSMSNETVKVISETKKWQAMEKRGAGVRYSNQ